MKKKKKQRRSPLHTSPHGQQWVKTFVLIVFCIRSSNHKVKEKHISPVKPIVTVPMSKDSNLLAAAVEQQPCSPSMCVCALIVFLHSLSGVVKPQSLHAGIFLTPCFSPDLPQKRNQRDLMTGVQLPLMRWTQRRTMTLRRSLRGVRKSRRYRRLHDVHKHKQCFSFLNIQFWA